MKTIKALSGFAAASALLLTGAPLAFADPGDSISGGGQVLHSTEYDDFKISFGIWANEATTGMYEGELQVNFHSTGPGLAPKSKFHGTEITEFVVVPGDSLQCNTAMRLRFKGTLDGVPGYIVTVRGGDAGSPGNTNAAEPFDTVRFEVATEGGPVFYDTLDEFPRQSDCVGTARTGLDRGNLTIEMM